jgi:hypothetical protein
MTGLLDIFNYGTGNDFLNEKKKEIERLERGSLYRAGGGDAQNTWRSGDQSQKKSFQETMMKNNQWGNQNPNIEADNSLSRKEKLIKAYTPNQNVANASKSFFSKIADSSKNIYIDDQGNKRNRNTGKIITTDDKKWGMDDTGGADLGKWHGNNQQEQLKWWQVLANKAGIDFNKATASWKEKGGFEGLMANPAFTMGLAFMQAGAEGKTLGAGALDNVMKAGGISMHYKKIIEDRAGDPVTEVTTGQMDSIKGVLKSIGTDKPGWWRKIMPGNQSEMYEQAVEDVAFKVQKKVGDMKKAAKKSGRKIEVGTRLYKKIIKEMMESGEIQSKGGVKIGGYQIIDKTLEAKAQGGPVQAGKPYVVGEKGPEVVVPKADANVVSNDDSQVMGMLLASNPQLQNVSRPRAESILRSRFPDYFA